MRRPTRDDYVLLMRELGFGDADKWPTRKINRTLPIVRKWDVAARQLTGRAAVVFRWACGEYANGRDPKIRRPWRWVTRWRGRLPVGGRRSPLPDRRPVPAAGVAGTIARVLSAADESAPVSPEALCERLRAAVPGMSADQIRLRVAYWVPAGLVRKYGLDVRRNVAGYWIRGAGNVSGA